MIVVKVLIKWARVRCKRVAMRGVGDGTCIRRRAGQLGWRGL